MQIPSKLSYIAQNQVFLSFMPSCSSKRLLSIYAAGATKIQAACVEQLREIKITFDNQHFKCAKSLQKRGMHLISQSGLCHLLLQTMKAFSLNPMLLQKRKKKRIDLFLLRQNTGNRPLLFRSGISTASPLQCFPLNFILPCHYHLIILTSRPEDDGKSPFQPNLKLNSK